MPHRSRFSSRRQRQLICSRPSTLRRRRVRPIRLERETSLPSEGDSGPWTGPRTTGGDYTETLDGLKGDYTETLDESVLVPPLVIGSQDAATLIDIFLPSMDKCGLDLKRLAASFDVVVLFIAVDSSPAIALFIDWLMGVLSPNVVVIKDLCNMHKLNRIVFEHTKRSDYDINTLFSLSKVVHIFSYYDVLCSAVLTAAFEQPLDWLQFGGPSLQDADDHILILKWCVPDLHLQKERYAACVGALNVLNSKWLRSRVGHCCTIVRETGLPCCASMDDVKRRVKKAIVVLLFWCLPPIPCAARWLTCVGTAGWWLLGCLVHGLFLRGFALAWCKDAVVVVVVVVVIVAVCFSKRI